MQVDKAVSDYDYKASDAIVDLYKKRIDENHLTKLISVGNLGIKTQRKMVPTRWSITAVDSNIGKNLIKKTKTFPWINEFRVYYHNQFDNRWIILMMPSEWEYELIEAWYPNTTWNQYSRDISIFNSYEFYEGRKTYAEIGGCYYAARLAINESLHRERRQAASVIMREAHPGYIMPIGVWNVRESVRRTLINPYRKCDTINEALNFIEKYLDIPISRWIKNSALLKNRLYQKRLEDFIGIN